jgi:hypothetical protein
MKRYYIYSKRNPDWTFEGAEGWRNTSKSTPSSFSEDDAKWIIDHLPEDEKELAEMEEVEEIED